MLLLLHHPIPSPLNFPARKYTCALCDAVGRESDEMHKYLQTDKSTHYTLAPFQLFSTGSMRKFASSWSHPFHPLCSRWCMTDNTEAIGNSIPSFLLMYRIHIVFLHRHTSANAQKVGVNCPVIHNNPSSVAADALLPSHLISILQAILPGQLQHNWTDDAVSATRTYFSLSSQMTTQEHKR